MPRVIRLVFGLFALTCAPLLWCALQSPPEPYRNTGCMGMALGAGGSFDLNLAPLFAAGICVLVAAAFLISCAWPDRSDANTHRP
jgi:hypothetical protein